MAANDLSSRNYIRWDASGVGKVPPGEAEDIQAVAEMINTMQKHNIIIIGTCMEVSYVSRRGAGSG
jgi:hypothetical protein